MLLMAGNWWQLVFYQGGGKAPPDLEMKPRIMSLSLCKSLKEAGYGRILTRPQMKAYWCWKDLKLICLTLIAHTSFQLFFPVSRLKRVSDLLFKTEIYNSEVNCMK